MRIILLTILVLCKLSNGFSQYIAKYEETLVTEFSSGTSVHNLYVSANGLESVYLVDAEATKALKGENKKTENIPAGAVVSTGKKNVTIPSRNIQNLKKDSLYSVNLVRTKYYVIAEPMPKMNWKLSNEQKKIGTYTVKKATLDFRGRTYSAWYAPEYPIKSGPWKFQGLPGLIVEISDKTGEYQWKLVSFKKEDFNADVFDFPKEKLPIISIQKFAEIQFVDKSSLQSKLPQGMKIISSSKNYSKELKFEWQK